MEDHSNPLLAAHLLQHTLRSLCIHDSSLWVYAVFWRILPRNYPPPNWDFDGGAFRSRGNRRNWILVWEDGFCNFAASTAENGFGSSSSVYRNCDLQHFGRLQPEVFFKMSHEIYNCGEGLIGKVAADNSHKWVYIQHNTDQEINLSAWPNSDSQHPRTWKAQFQSGLKTIALIGVKEGVLQLGSFNKVKEDLNYVVQLQRKFSHLQSIPGFLLPHPSSSTSSSLSIPFQIYGTGAGGAALGAPNEWPNSSHSHDHHFTQPVVMMTPSMSSLEALLSKLPSVMPASFSSLPEESTENKKKGNCRG